MESEAGREAIAIESLKLDEQDIENALAQNRFEVQFQPQLSLCEDGKVLGAEAFVRLQHPEFGILVPNVFLPLVKRMGKMQALTAVVVEQVAEAWASWQQQGFDLRVAINIDRELFADPQLADLLRDSLTHHQVPKRRLTLEISQAGNDFLNPAACEQLTRLRMRGFRLSLDDFGLVPGVEKQLGELPIDEIKIHRQVIENIDTQVEARETVQRALHLASRLGVRVVAMGIERLRQVNWLKNIGCDSGQGYFYGKPMTCIEFSDQILADSGSWSISTEDQLSLLVIDDDDQHRDMLFDVFSNMFHVLEAKTGAEARELFAVRHPEMLVVDINLPDVSGIELCRELLGQDASKMTSALFVSGEDSVQNRLQAYDAGGTDFIAKPFHTNEMVAKVGRIAAHLQRRKQLAANVDEFQSVAQQSMREAAHYGDIVQFFKNLLICADERSIARELFRVMKLKGLHASVQFINGSIVNSFDQSASVCSPIEVNVFELLRQKGRLYDFGKRTIVNDQHVSFLIKNMPEDEAEHGRVRDYVAVMIEGMEARYRDILKGRALRSVFQQLKQLAVEMADAVSADKQQQSEMLEKFSLDLNMSFHALDLSEEQEAHITRIIENMLRAKDDHADQEIAIRERVERIVAELSESIAGLDETVDAPESYSDAGDNGDDSVELF